MLHIVKDTNEKVQALVAVKRPLEDQILKLILKTNLFI